MKTSQLWPVLALPLAIVACTPANDANVADNAALDTTMNTVPPADTGMMMGDTGMMAGANRVSMAPVNNSGVTGTATFTPMGNQTQVMVQLMSAPEGSHEGHIHQGSCANLGQVVEPLETINVDASMMGTSTSTVAMADSAVMDGQHVVAFHKAGGDPGQPVVCGDIPMHRM